VDLVDPRLDRLVAGVGGDVDLLDDAQLVPADRAGVEAVPERLGGGAIGLLFAAARLRFLCAHRLLRKGMDGKRRRACECEADRPRAAARQKLSSGRPGSIHYERLLRKPTGRRRHPVRIVGDLTRLPPRVEEGAATVALLPLTPFPPPSYGRTFTAFTRRWNEIPHAR
jgi:hypothetical protein